MRGDSQSGWLLDPERLRLRREWVHAYWGWTQAAGNKTSTSIVLSDEQYTALRAYHDAEAAYFTHRRMVTGD